MHVATLGKYSKCATTTVAFTYTPAAGTQSVLAGTYSSASVTVNYAYSKEAVGPAQSSAYGIATREV